MKCREIRSHNPKDATTSKDSRWLMGLAYIQSFSFKFLQLRDKKKLLSQKKHMHFSYENYPIIELKTEKISITYLKVLNARSYIII